MIERDLTPRLLRLADQFPALTLTGPRQSGKSTLCRAVFPEHEYANLEAPDVRSFATDDPRGFLAQFKGGAILDEIQRVPEIASYLQGVIDAEPGEGRWVLTGSQHFALSDAVNQSLAGRAGILHLLPLSYPEVKRFELHPTSMEEALLTGGYPRILDRGLDPGEWLRSYVATYIERDVRTISNIGDLVTFQRFVELCAGRTGQLLKYASLASDSGVAQPTAKEWMSVLETSFLAFRLPSFASNLRKRLVKMPKVHFFDTGLACWLLGIRSAEQLRSHPLRGSIFETWVVSEICKHRTNLGLPMSSYHYRDQNGVEGDVVVDHGTKLTLVEVKAAQTIHSESLRPITGIQEILSKQRPCHAVVVYGGESRQERSGVTILPWSQLHEYDWS